jgi:hypothetical protein
MSLDFFSQFLRVEGMVTDEELGKAMTLINIQHQSLGDLAVEAGYMNKDQALELNKEQLIRDVPFGMLATEQGLLSENQLQHLLTRQSQQHLQLADVLVELGCLDGSKLDSILVQFADALSPKADELFNSIAPLSESRVARYVVDSFPKLTMRVSQIHVKVSGGQDVSADLTNDYTASIALTGTDGIKMSISSDKQFARSIMNGMSRIMSGDSNLAYGDSKSDFEDLLGGFLDIIAGQAIGALQTEAIKLTMGTPTFGFPSDGGYAFLLQTTVGQATLILNRA